MSQPQPTDSPAHLTIACYLARGAKNDVVLIDKVRHPHAHTLSDLAQGCISGIRGNLNTRLRKCVEQLYDAIVLAQIGVELNLIMDKYGHLIKPAESALSHAVHAHQAERRPPQGEAQGERAMRRREDAQAEKQRVARQQAVAVEHKRAEQAKAEKRSKQQARTALNHQKAASHKQNCFITNCFITNCADGPTASSPTASSPTASMSSLPRRGREPRRVQGAAGHRGAHGRRDEARLRHGLLYGQGAGGLLRRRPQPQRGGVWPRDALSKETQSLLKQDAQRDTKTACTVDDQLYTMELKRGHGRAPLLGRS